ncbi:MAG: TetR/AcrR family transcriptional regulator [Erysipelotrichia bacterium]|nr:TetR/AcrR family transcriptional regulator [Erysipelotrichia bacterium]
MTKGIFYMSTKEQILEATLELASAQGLGSLSLSQIAGKVGIQKQSLYNYFSSKDEIVHELYVYLRQKAKQHSNIQPVDYGQMVKGRAPIEVLTRAVKSYIKMNEDPDMNRFYMFIMSERSINPEAAEIMTAETERMILETKQLFYAMQVHHVMKFDNTDTAAFSFAMTVHSIMDYRCDQKISGRKQTADELLQDYLKEFCRIYGDRKK